MAFVVHMLYLVILMTTLYSKYYPHIAGGELRLKRNHLPKVPAENSGQRKQDKSQSVVQLKRTQNDVFREHQHGMQVPSHQSHLQ